MSSSHIVSLDIVLNELSFEPPVEKIYDAWPLMRSLVETLRAYMAVDPTEIKALLVTSDVMRIPLAGMYTVSSWCQDRQVPDDDRNFFLGLSTPKPFLDRDQMECHYQGRFGAGFTVAWRDSFPAASVHSADHWDATHLDIDATVLNDAGDDYVLQRVQVCHACRADHVRTHTGWLRSRVEEIKRGRRELFRSGLEIWNRREELFPHLGLGTGVLRQLCNLGRGDERLTQVVGRLFSLERYCASWNDGPFDPTQLPGEPRHESEAALNEYGDERMFAYPDGSKHLFSWHISVPIEGWRLYFEPIPSELRSEHQGKRMIIGYLGQHLPTKKFN